VEGLILRAPILAGAKTPMESEAGGEGGLEPASPNAINTG
jgi:hypothetical protein